MHLGLLSGTVLCFSVSLQVQFDDDSINRLTEEFIYSINEPLPRKVRDCIKVSD